ncbi:SMI1/KNR4 family protein [Pseudomonas sp. CCOS 191]|uniref:SMI1/KNR4 family protein n=1 Tax=Pseudomonas sp. CCOS 191 TaxID=1649877 RepID=UPI0006248E56|nr:SMI1/KNR4 family protein [Pseudomonas sp. CCOS 191]CRI56987.1 hypothetical protein CCOS191_2451 [Pseudomonas sp. CCOS 191]
MLVGLMKMLPPPDSPAYPNPDWARVENDHGIRLPADYKAFIERFGAGCIDDFLWVIDPFSSSRDLNFDKGDYFRESYAVMKAEFPSDYPRPGYPAEGAFWPWGFTENGETLVWIVKGEPDSWSVALHSVDQGEEYLIACGCIELLCKLFRREIHSCILPEGFPSARGVPYRFVPFK